jgi:hypothetical protein
MNSVVDFNISRKNKMEFSSSLILSSRQSLAGTEEWQRTEAEVEQPEA